MKYQEFFYFLPKSDQKRAFIKVGLWGEVRGGAHDFAPLLKFSVPPLRSFAPPLIILITK